MSAIHTHVSSLFPLIACENDGLTHAGSGLVEAELDELLDDGRECLRAVLEVPAVFSLDIDERGAEQERVCCRALAL